VHRSLGEQHQDGRADVTSTTAPTVSAAAATATTGPETRTEATGTEATGTEATSESAAETRSEGTVVAGLGPDRLAELATGLPTLLVQGTAVLGCETEVRWSTGERAAHLGPACFKEWVIH
jgi:hypothetical protein